MGYNSKQVIRNITASLSYKIILLVAGLLVPRLYIHDYGSALNGMIASIQQIVTFSALLEAGISTASIQALYEPLIKKNWGEVSGIISASAKFYKRTGNWFSIGSFIFALIYPFIISDKVNYFMAFSMFLAICLPSAIEYYLHGKYRVLLTADQKLYVVTYIMMVGTILSTILRVILINYKVNIVIVQVLPSIVFLMRVYVLFIYCKKKYPNINYTFKPNIQSLSKSRAVLVHQISGLITDSTPSIVLTCFVGLKAVSVYFVYNLVFSSIIGIVLEVFSQSFVASFGKLIAINERQIVRDKFREYEFVFYICITIIFSITVVMLLPFVKFYTKGVTDIDYNNEYMAVLFTIGQLFNCIRMPGGMLITASGLFKETQWRAIIQSTIGIIVSMIFITRLGILSILIGNLCGYFYRMVDILYFTNKRIINDSILITLSRVIRSIALITIVFIISKNIGSFEVESWIDFFIKTLCISIVLVVAFIVINFLIEKETSIKIISYFHKNRKAVDI